MLPDFSPVKTQNKLRVYLPQAHFLWENLHLSTGTQDTPLNSELSDQPSIMLPVETTQEIEHRDELIAFHHLS